MGPNFMTRSLSDPQLKNKTKQQKKKPMLYLNPSSEVKLNLLFLWWQSIQRPQFHAGISLSLAWKGLRRELCASSEMKAQLTSLQLTAPTWPLAPALPQTQHGHTVLLFSFTCVPKHLEISLSFWKLSYALKKCCFYILSNDSRCQVILRAILLES